MCWKCDNPNGTTEQYLDGLRATIDDHGWAVQGVEDDKRPFTYTVGLHGQGLSELIITGMATHTAARLLNSIAHMITEDGTALAPAMHIDHQDEFLFEVVAVDHPDVHLRYSTMLFGDGVRALQLVWADARGRWPWDAGWGHGRRRQPVLGVRAQVPPLQG
ncbi:DUF4262 domain-containing protein [Mycobacterium sp. 21AC1]|uniref:DUF4262 domain-containing protein n=1 Tax=[Mycobacterium] appelbergii TaxID=2939269 RepID=UPI002938FD61|nr:DUF4262 domain-containing protein [Mycobacterium sp. 21AC1]MDV3124956.1 DUF4262 domain-containing protein [Mycobacterium sp. 21AC1]